MSDEAQEYELVMPFVVTHDEGGPYEAESFVAGYECGFLAFAIEATKTLPTVIERWVSPALIPQLDLVAMKFGRKLLALDVDESGEWQRIRVGHPSIVDED